MSHAISLIVNGSRRDVTLEDGRVTRSIFCESGWACPVPRRAATVASVAPARF